MSIMTETRQQISYGKLISRRKYEESSFFPDEIRSHLPNTPYYLYIYVPADRIVKVSIFACDSSKIKKILISLKEFAPELVKGISTVLKNFNLGKGTIHTTGLCFESSKCFYETYVDESKLKESDISFEEIQKEFLKVERIEEVRILDIEVENSNQ